MPDRKVKVILDAIVGGFNAKVTSAGKAVRDTADNMTKAGKEAETFRRGLDELGGTAGKAGLAAAAGLGAIVLTAARFDKSMSSVQAATHETAANMELLRAAAIKAGADTAFSASEAADGITELAKAGVSTKDVLSGGLSGALDLAAAGQISVADAAEYTATALTQFQLEGDKATHVADLLAAGAGKAQGEVQDMALALNYAGVPAANLGVSIEETAGTIALLAKNGVIGEKAGTSLRGMLASLTSPSNKAAQEMKNLGIQVFDATGHFVGFDGVAAQLHDRLGGLTDAERANALGRIFGNEQLQAANILYREGAEGVQEWTRAVDDQGYAAETAAIKMNNLAGDWEQFTGSVETALIGMGEGSQGPLRSIVQGLTDATNAFSGLPPVAQQSVTALLGITAITGGGLWFGSKVVRGVADTRQALADLGVTSERTSTAMEGIGEGVEFAAIVTGFNLIDAAVDQVFSNDLDQSRLGRSLEALAGGRVTGEIRSVFGEDLSGLVKDVKRLSGEAGLALTDNMIDWVPGFESGTEKARDRLASIDDALAALVESGQQDEAAAVFARMAAAAEDAGVSTSKLRDIFDQYSIAVDNANGVNNGYGFGLDVLGGIIDGLPPKVEKAAAKHRQLSKAAKEARQAAHDQASAWLEFGDSLDDADVSMGEWIESMRKQADALQHFTTNAQTAAKRGLRDGLIAALKEAGPEGALRMRQLANATREEIGKANRAWDSQQRAMERYERFQLHPKRPQVDTRSAETSIARLIRQMNNIPDEVVNVTTVFGTSGSRYTARAPGGRFDSGGYTGDMPVSEAAGVVHGREFVFDAVSTARAGVGNLYAMQRQLRGYAGGGYVEPVGPTRQMLSGYASAGSAAPAVPSVSVGAPRVQVFVDGVETKARVVVRQETAADRRFDTSMAGRRPA